MDNWDGGLNDEPELCNLCATFEIGDVLTENEHGLPLRVAHHSSYEALESAASQGCHMCKVLQKGVLDDALLYYSQDKDTMTRRQRLLDAHGCAGFDLSAYYVPEHAKRGSPYQSTQKGYYYIWYDRVEDDFQRHGLRPALRLIPWSSCAYVARMLPPLPDFDLCRDWLYTCASRHYTCPALEERDLPTRILHVGTLSQPRLRLMESKGVKGEYVALSHCWGGRNPPTTTADNYLANMAAINYEALPKTFQDAIVATRSLGFQYLWIDAFCILQGPSDEAKADFERECARMAQTFENAGLTICGPAADSPYAGFLHARPVDNVRPCKLTRRVEGISFEAMLLCSRDHWYERHLTRGPQYSASRAWIFQERLLSPRVLYFGRDQMYFECLESDCYESLRQIDHGGSNTGKRGLRQRWIAQENVWLHIVSDFTSRKLTVESDRLPALSGVAHRMQDRRGDRYVAGLWEEDIRTGLMWYVDNDDGAQNSLVPASKRAPTWSWASCDKHVSFPTLGYNDLSGKSLTVVLHFEVSSVEAPAIGQDPYGEVHDGKLVMHGKVLGSRLRALKDEDDEDALTLCEASSRGCQIAEIFSPDVPASKILQQLEDDTIVAACILLATLSHDDSSAAIAMVLQPIDARGETFRRLGLAVFTKGITSASDIPDVFCKCVGRDLTIL